MLQKTKFELGEVSDRDRPEHCAFLKCPFDNASGNECSIS